MAKLPRQRIDRAPTRFQMIAIPVASVMLGSLLPILPIIASMPILPPMGFMFLIAWRLLQRTMWPVWIALPLGLFDDMFSGQPIGSAIFLWTLAFLALDLFDRRMIWRDTWQDWGLASVLTTALLLTSLEVANATGGHTSPIVLLPQIVIAVLLFPSIARACALLDTVRLSA
jgi:rod shape-determining protein MreD